MRTVSARVLGTTFIQSHHTHRSTNTRVASNVPYKFHFAVIRYERIRRSTALPLSLCFLYASSSDKEFKAMPTILGVRPSDAASETPTSDVSCAGRTYHLSA